MERRDVVRCLAWVIAGTAAAACTPFRIITRAFPEEFKRDRALVKATLRAFATAVIPRAHSDTSDPARALLDHRYPLARYAPFLASDLAQRSERRYGTPAFTTLTLEQRTAVIAEGLSADATTRKLYRGAVYLTQIAVYAGIYDDAAGCALIGFSGRYRGGQISYENAAVFLPAPLTSTGNYE